MAALGISFICFIYLDNFKFHSLMYGQKPKDLHYLSGLALVFLWAPQPVVISGSLETLDVCLIPLRSSWLVTSNKVTVIAAPEAAPEALRAHLWCFMAEGQRNRVLSVYLHWKGGELLGLPQGERSQSKR